MPQAGYLSAGKLPARLGLVRLRVRTGDERRSTAHKCQPLSRLPQQSPRSPSLLPLPPPQEGLPGLSAVRSRCALRGANLWPLLGRLRSLAPPFRTRCDRLRSRQQQWSVLPGARARARVRPPGSWPAAPPLLWRALFPFPPFTGSLFRAAFPISSLCGCVPAHLQLCLPRLILVT